MTAGRAPGQRWPAVTRLLPLVAIVTALAVAGAACERDVSTDGAVDVPRTDGSIELRDETGPRVDDPARGMAMTVDAVESHGDDVLVRVRVENTGEGYLDMGVEDTIYGPLLVMHDDRGNRYDAYAVEPAGVPGRRVADLSFRLAGPLDRDAETFTMELRTQRGVLTTPTGELPEGDGVRWRVDEAAGSRAVYAAPPRLPELIHFWLETDPLPDDR